MVVRTQGFKNDLPHGKWAEYSDRGELTAEGSYKNAVKTGTWTYYKDGNVSFQVKYEDGLKVTPNSK